MKRLTKEEKKALIEVKKARRLEKKKIREEKRALKSHSNAALYKPENMSGSKAVIVLGYFLRFFSIGFSIFGVIELFADAFKIPVYNHWLLLLYCVSIVSAFSLIFIGKFLIFAGIGILAVLHTAIFLICGNPLTFYVSGIETVFNATMHRLEETGFAYLNDISIYDFGGLTAADTTAALMFGGLATITLFLAVIFSAFSAKKTRLLPMLVFGGGLCVICFTYNLCNSNFGIACVLAGLCSAIVLSTYDKIYEKHKNSRKSRAFSGFSSALAGILCLGIVMVPAANITTPWRDIPVISEGMQDARTILTTILTGGNPTLNKMNSLVRKADAKIDDVEFKEIVLFKVNSPLKSQNIYLRSWVASDYDYENDTWKIMSDKDYEEFEKSSRKNLFGITGDVIASRLRSLYDNDLLELPRVGNYISKFKKGYYYANIDVKYVNNNGLLYIMPSSFMPEKGLHKYNEHNANYGEHIQLYSDGIYSSNWFNLYKEYSAVASVPTYLSEDFPDYLEGIKKYYRAASDFIQNKIKNMSDKTDEYKLNAFEQELKKNGLENYGTSLLEDYLNTDKSVRYKWLEKNIETVSLYSEFIKNYYTSFPSESAGIQKAREEILDDFNSAKNDYEKIKAVIDYIVLNNDYSLKPEKPSGKYQSDLDAFLLETNEGYCVQFATAATLLLRSFGFPARYVQGYIASDFSKDPEKMMNMYTSNVLDSNAHAWVEVWIDGYGWLTIEATTKYYDKIYYIDRSSENDEKTSEIIDKIEKSADDHVPQNVDPKDKEKEDIDKNDTSKVEENSGTIKITIFLILLGIVALAIIIVIVLLLLRTRKIVENRNYFIERARYGHFEDETDLLLVAGVLSDTASEQLSILNIRPKEGESPLEFADRIDNMKSDSKKERKALKLLSVLPYSLSRIFTISEKIEFGNQVSREDLSDLGEFVNVLNSVGYKQLNPFKKIFYRYFKNMI